MQTPSQIARRAAKKAELEHMQRMIAAYRATTREAEVAFLCASIIRIEANKAAHYAALREGHQCPSILIELRYRVDDSTQVVGATFSVGDLYSIEIAADDPLVEYAETQWADDYDGLAEDPERCDYWVVGDFVATDVWASF